MELIVHTKVGRLIRSKRDPSRSATLKLGSYADTAAAGGDEACGAVGVPPLACPLQERVRISAYTRDGALASFAESCERLGLGDAGGTGDSGHGDGDGRNKLRIRCSYSPHC